MEKLKRTIEQYGRWTDLSIYIGRIETHIESDFSHSLENAKALLETFGKEICKEKGLILSETSSINGVLKSAFSALGYSNNNLVNKIASALATIGQQVGELRNEIGLTSHGKSLDEIKERNNRVNKLTRDFLIDTIEIVSCFLIRNFENENPRKSKDLLEEKLDYTEAEEFNEFWDDSFGEFEMGTYAYTASEILFNVDKQAYINEYNSFKLSETRD
jgi:hypothetical protein